MDFGPCGFSGGFYLWGLEVGSPWGRCSFPACERGEVLSTELSGGVPACPASQPHLQL